MNRLRYDDSDQGLLKALSRQDSEAIQALYDDYLPMVCQMVMQNQGSEEDARDLFQEAVMVLYDKSKDPSFILSCKIKTYLYAVSRRLWLKQLQQKKKKRMEEHLNGNMLEPVGITEDIKEYEAQEAQFNTMHEALEKLGEPCKSLLESFYLKHLSMVEIAENFGYTNPDNAKTQKYKCLNRLKKIFFEQYKKETL